MKILTKRKKGLFGDKIVKLFYGRVGFLQPCDKLIKLRNDVEFNFFPKFECYTLESLKMIIKELEKANK